MKLAPITIVLTILIAVAIGVLFSIFYPEVEITGGLAALFTLVALLIALLLVGIFSRSKRKAE